MVSPMLVVFGSTDFVKLKWGLITVKFTAFVFVVDVGRVRIGVASSILILALLKFRPSSAPHPSLAIISTVLVSPGITLSIVTFTNVSLPSFVNNVPFSDTFTSVKPFGNSSITLIFVNIKFPFVNGEVIFMINLIVSLYPTTSFPSMPFDAIIPRIVISAVVNVDVFSAESIRA